MYVCAVRLLCGVCPRAGSSSSWSVGPPIGVDHTRVASVVPLDLDRARSSHSSVIYVESEKYFCQAIDLEGSAVCGEPSRHAIE